jgi:hypothetical protein
MKYSVAELAEAFSVALAEVARVFSEQSHPWMLVGGLAIGGWTEPRATRDCDFAVALPEDPSALALALQSAGFSITTDQLRTAVEGGPIRMRLDRPGSPALTVDLLCAGTPFEHEALRRRRSLEVLGVALYVATPDDLLIYKLIAGRPQDLADIDRLIRFGRAPEDETYVRKWAREWDVEAELERVLALARNSS